MTDRGIIDSAAIVLTFLVLTLAGCSRPAAVYLHPGRDLAAVAVGQQPAATVIVQRFREDFGDNETVGEHLYDSRGRTLLKIKRQEVANTVESLVLSELSARGIDAAFGDGWDGTPEDLASYQPPVRLLIGGRVSTLEISAEESLVDSKARATVDIECALGLVAEKKVITRRVHVVQEMIKFSHKREQLEELLDRTLTDAARQAVAQFDGYLQAEQRNATDR